MEQQQQLLLCCCSQLDKHSISLLVHMLVVGVVTTWPCQHCRHTKASRSHIQAHTKTIILTPVLSLCTNTSALRPLNSKIAKIVVKEKGLQYPVQAKMNGRTGDCEPRIFGFFPLNDVMKLMFYVMFLQQQTNT